MSDPTDTPAFSDLKAKLTARARLMVRARETLINIADELDDEGDRVFFGSTNDADRFRDFVRALDDWAWSDIIADASERDYIGELREANEAIETWRDQSQCCRAAYDALTAERDRLREALERLASNEALTTSFYVPNNAVGDELKARLEYARAALSISEKKEGTGNE